MKTTNFAVLVSMFSISLVACQAPEELSAALNDADTGLASTANESLDEEPEPEPTPSASPTPSVTKSLLSTWTRDDGYYSVDLRNLVDQDPTASGIYTNERANFVFTASVTCSAVVLINGSENLGMMTISSSQSTAGSQSANNAYCDPLEGTYEYAAIGADQYRLCKLETGVCHNWE